MSDDIPRKLIFRDPRNPAHISEAINLVSRVGRTRLTQRSADLLSSLGVQPPKGMKITKGGHYDTVVGGFYFLDVGLHLPDSVIATCAVCSTALQVTVENSSKPKKLCCFCMADQALAEYWAKQAKRSDKKRPRVGPR